MSVKKQKTTLRYRVVWRGCALVGEKHAVDKL
jgi:hypothetical protein